jgi:hypothetical protein
LSSQQLELGTIHPPQNQPHHPAHQHTNDQRGKEHAPVLAAEIPSTHAGQQIETIFVWIASGAEHLLRTSFNRRASESLSRGFPLPHWVLLLIESSLKRESTRRGGWFKHRLDPPVHPRPNPGLPSLKAVNKTA